MAQLAALGRAAALRRLRLPRLQLVEVHDLPRCPPLLRRTLTALLERAVRWTRVYEAALPLLERLLEAGETGEVLDLCSGGGGPWRDLAPRLARSGRPLRVTLSDLYPDAERLGRYAAESAGLLAVAPVPVDATRAPAEHRGVRTLFSSFHHFPPPLAREILADAARRRVPIGVFEGSERGLATCLGLALGLVPAVLVWTPALRPWRLARFVWTYVVPVFPLVMLWDGVVSNLRTYSPEELRGLVEGIEAEGYAWEVGVLRPPGLRLAVTYVIGVPTSA